VANHDLDEGRMIQASDLFDWIRQHPQEFGTTNPRRLCTQLSKQAVEYGRFLHGEDQNGNTEPALAGIAYQLIGVRQHLPLLLAATGFQQAPFWQLSNGLETLTFVLAVTKQPWNQLETRLPSWCAALRGIPPAGGQPLQDFLDSEVTPWIQGLSDLFWRGLDRTDTLRDSLVRYLLVELEEFIRKQGKVRSIIPSDRTVEHIFPQGPNPTNLADFFGTDMPTGVDAGERTKDVVYSIGNLAILTTNENSVADRHLYADKCADPYTATDFRLTRYLAIDMKMGVNAAINQVITDFNLAPVPSWNARALAQRRGIMRSLMVARWPMIPPP
jgi:hypothetical protein